MGLWEGVPLRDVIALTRPLDNVRRVYYYGYHNDDPEQMFRSSLSINRVLEDPPGELPVIVCYKLNGEWLSPKRGGPARMLVPEAYGFKSVKWLQRVVLTNEFRANDTYANDNNDVDSTQKSFARFVRVPERVKVGQSIPITGLAQSGMGGLSKVQYSIEPVEPPWSSDDPYFATATWHDAQLLPPPNDWGAEFEKQKLPEMPLQFDPATGKPRMWPLRYALAHWAALACAGRRQVPCPVPQRRPGRPCPAPAAHVSPFRSKPHRQRGTYGRRSAGAANRGHLRGPIETTLTVVASRATNACLFKSSRGIRPERGAANLTHVR